MGAAPTSLSSQGGANSAPRPFVETERALTVEGCFTPSAGKSVIDFPIEGIRLIKGIRAIAAATKV
jgi:hypothetical protein